MDIEVRGGSKPLWVSEFGCYLPDGGMAFSYEQYPERPQPSWLRVPEGSQLRESRNSKNPEYPMTESRSTCANAAQVLGFYRDCADRGNLVQVESPVVDTRLQMTQLSRTEPGFFAENEEYYFSVEIFQHKETTFWTVKHGQKLPPAFRSKREPKYLLFVREENGRVILRNPDTGDEYWARVEATTDSKPPFVLGTRREPAKEVPILWALMPSWMQFDLPNNTVGSAVTIPVAGCWAAGLPPTRFVGSAHDRLEIFLNSLDEHGFDGSGIERSDRSYFITCMTGGRHMGVRIKTETEESGSITVVSTLDPPVFYLHYSAPGSQLPGAVVTLQTPN
jgi:hypothetical protein